MERKSEMKRARAEKKINVTPQKVNKRRSKREKKITQYYAFAWVFRCENFCLMNRCFRYDFVCIRICMHSVY